MDTPKQHTNRRYERELNTLRERLLLMAGRVEEMIARAVQALVQRDIALARKIIEADARVNRDEIETDELCLLILAKRQPMASDLRFITLALKMVTDLERIGDLAVNICERAIALVRHPDVTPSQTIPRMAVHAQSMIKNAVDAFINGDIELAERVIARDDDVDQLYTSVFQELLDLMMQDPTKIQPVMQVQKVAKYLERIADHATNLAEQVYYMVKGKDIRHSGKLS